MKSVWTLWLGVRARTKGMGITCCLFFGPLLLYTSFSGDVSLGIDEEAGAGAAAAALGSGGALPAPPERFLAKPPAEGRPERDRGNHVPWSAPPRPPKVVSSKPVWIFCAAQWMECICPGTVRWGSEKKWMDIQLKAGETEQKVKCSIQELPDVAPGETAKHCLCAVYPGTAYFESMNPALLPDHVPETAASPLAASCDLFQSSSDTPWGARLWEATEPFCSRDWASDPAKGGSIRAGELALEFDTMRSLQKAWIDKRFVVNHDRLYDKSGWVPRAFINYYAGAPGGKHSMMTEELVNSVHKFSSFPIVVVHFGTSTPEDWSPERFPRLVLLHAAPLPPSARRSFNFNKFRAMLLARARTGVQLDSDQFVAPGVDSIFFRTEEEVTQAYPMPILPAHFLDRTPRDLGDYWERYCPGGDCRFQTARWGHAHPTWTFWAAPFIGRWLRRNLRDETLAPQDGRDQRALKVMQHVPEDEDLLNVATWEEGGTKQWCKLDLPGPSDFEALLAAKPGSRQCDSGPCGDITSDHRFHPSGVAKVFYTAHHAVNPKETRSYISRLERFNTENRTILYKGHWYRDGKELHAAHPEVTCLI